MERLSVIFKLSDLLINLQPWIKFFWTNFFWTNFFFFFWYMTGISLRPFIYVCWYLLSVEVTPQCVNSAFCVCNKILTLSKGATIDFPAIPATPPATMDLTTRGPVCPFSNILIYIVCVNNWKKGQILIWLSYKRKLFYTSMCL